MTEHTDKPPIRRRSVLKGAAAGAIGGSIATESVKAGNDQWPDSCDAVEEDGLLSIDGEQYQGSLSPNDYDVLRFDMAEGEQAIGAARFETPGTTRLNVRAGTGTGPKITLTTLAGEPFDNHEHVNRWHRSDGEGYDIKEAGSYEFRMFAEVENPCLEISTEQESAGSWALSLKAGEGDPPTIEDPETIEERVSELESKVESLEQRVNELEEGGTEG